MIVWFLEVCKIENQNNDHESFSLCLDKIGVKPSSHSLIVQIPSAPANSLLSKKLCADPACWLLGLS